MVVWTDDFIDTDGVHLHYHRTNGNKPSMILLHGVTDNALCWTSIARDLQAQYDVIMPDARGHGKSTITTTGSPFSIADMAEDTATLATRLELDHPVLMGHSLGGLVATLVASMHPDLPSKLILEDPAYILGSMKLFVPLFRRLFINSVKNMGKRTVDEEWADIKKHNRTWSDEDVDVMAIAHQEFVRNSNLDHIKHFNISADWESIIPRITCPVLLLIPSNGFLRLIVAKRLLPSFKNARIGYIPRASHGVHRDQYAKSMDAINSFLA